jgi:hypothetical protein
MDYTIYNFAVAALTAAKTMYNEIFPEEYIVDAEIDSDDETWLDAIDVLVSVTDEAVYNMESVKAFVYDIV